ncbi:hypothetical protein E3J38_09390 [candidate division TA06 bacterium]|uniref:DUF5683 domain-containing protein n=1 Tax=candidate division TA06 bacterium TaxID=2250710 RepID=A0A523XEU6_UNCT6|nr:MAG: hypothetical protein E3J38_09390 [candidate division TA06 bacterium]
MRRSGARSSVLATTILLLPLTGWPAQQAAKSPFGAIVASAVLPGGGQFYCENYLRGAVFCAAQATVAGMILYEHILTEEAHRRYKLTGSMDDYGDYAHHFDRRYDLLWWGAGVWVFSMADAFVDAHMFKFGSKKRVRFGLAEEGVGLQVSLFF